MTSFPVTPITQSGAFGGFVIGGLPVSAGQRGPKLTNVGTGAQTQLSSATR